MKQYVAKKTQNFTTEQARVFGESLGIAQALEECHNMSGSHMALVIYEEFERRTTQKSQTTTNKVKASLRRASTKCKREQQIADNNPAPKLTPSSPSILNTGTKKSYLLHLTYIYFIWLLYNFIDRICNRRKRSHKEGSSQSFIKKGMHYVYMCTNKLLNNNRQE